MAKQNTKEKIFEVSIDLFSQYGYDGVSIRQIAKEVGIKESSIYNHYPSKESILDDRNAKGGSSFNAILSKLRFRIRHIL